MAEKVAPHRYSWRFGAAAPPREVFAVMEQMIGTPPYRYEVTGSDSARIIEVERKGFFGQWRGSPSRPRWVTCRAVQSDVCTVVEVEASRGRGPVPRALQLVYLLSRGNRDRRTIYRERAFPHGGPVTLVASWAGVPYLLYTEPSFFAPRGEKVHTAMPLVAVGEHGPFVKVRLQSGVEGYIERDQLVPAPAQATREAQTEVASLG
jgi:hypothetical protein